MKSQRYMMILAAVLGAPACSSLQGIDSVRPSLTALNDAAAAAQTHVGSTSGPAVKNYRLAVLTESAVNGDLARIIAGEGAPAPAAAAAPTAAAETGAPMATAPDRARLLRLATGLLCEAQRQRLVGATEVSNTSALARNLMTFDLVEPPDTIIENVALLSAEGRTPDVVGATPTTVQAAAQRAQDLCEADLRQAANGRLRVVSAGEETSATALLDLTGALDTALRAKTVALLQALVLAERLDDLRDYLRENKEEIDSLRAGLTALQGPLRERVILTRRMAAYNYLAEFDEFRVALEDLNPPARNPLTLSAARVDLRSVDAVEELLDAAAAYDEAMSDGAPQAFGDLAEAIADVQAIADNPRDAASTAASIRATMSFIGSMRALAEATDDPALQRAIDTAFPPRRRAAAGTPAPDEPAP